MSVEIKSPIAVVDVETSGLDAHRDRLLEIAVVIIDPVTLEPIDPDGFEAVVRYAPEQVRYMRRFVNPYVDQMHDKNGLWSDIVQPTAHPIKDVDARLLKYLRSIHKGKKQMPVMGNSVRLDMNFMDHWLPQSAGHLDYHMRDVSTIAGLASDWYDTPWFEKAKGHRAMDDVMECIAELRYYRDAVFKPVSGNTDYRITSLLDEVADMVNLRGDEDMRERLAKALHDALCWDEHDQDFVKYDPERGANSRYQRHADALLTILKGAR